MKSLRIYYDNIHPHGWWNVIIINADDLGRNILTTDRCLICHQNNRITSASIMVYMADSERAFEAVRSSGLDTGLHLNLDLPLDGPKIPGPLKERHLKVASFFSANKWTQILYNPLLKKDIDYVFRAQVDEFRRLLGEDPTRIDGHHHLHLCMNMLIGRVIPNGLMVRRNFTFNPGEKRDINRAYRNLVDRWLMRRYICSDAFYSLAPVSNESRLNGILEQAHHRIVELMVHPEVKDQYDFLMSDGFAALIATVPTGSYRTLPDKTPARSDRTPLGRYG